MTAERVASRLTSDVALIEDFWEWDELVHQHDWSDGLPVAPPTEERVGAIIDYLRRDPQDEIGNIPPQYGTATIEQVAIQCAMAGCIPKHVPVVIAAIEAMIDPAFNLHGVQCTTNPCAPLTIVSGPIVNDLKFNVRNGAFGGGGFANAAIGRAIRLILWNLGGGKPAINDMSPLGQSAKFTFCVAENLAQSPWPAFHTDFGFEPEDNVVTVFACSSPYPARPPGPAKMILDSLSEGLPSTTINMYNGAGQILVVLAVGTAVVLAQAGYTKDDVRQYLFENARLSIRHLKEHHLLDEPDAKPAYWSEGSLRDVRQNPFELSDDDRLPMVVSPEDIMVMVTGGDGPCWAGFCIGWGSFGGYALTRPITLPR
jgi:hypothetical protein